MVEAHVTDCMLVSSSLQECTSALLVVWITGHTVPSSSSSEGQVVLQGSLPVMVGLAVDSVSGSKLWLCIFESTRKNPFAARGRGSEWGETGPS